jgi:NADH-quinone oxidoreductase subunit M
MDPLDLFNANIPAVAVYTPILAGLLLLAGRRLPAAFASGFAFAGFALPLVLGLWLVGPWPAGKVAFTQLSSAGSPWGFEFGLNGLSAPLFLMTAVVGLAAGLKALEQEVESRNTYLGLLLFMFGGTLGVFATTSVLGAYFFHEFALIPTFLLTLFWGGAGRRPAAMQMAIYLTVGAMVALAGLLLALGAAKTGYTSTWSELLNTIDLRVVPAATTGLVLFGFGTLASLFPFHSWAAPGYTAAPTPASMLHAGALKKFGLYGILLVALNTLGGVHGSLAQWFLGLALANVVIVGLICLAQRDLKELLSWSSVAHMGPIFLGLWVTSVSGRADGVAAAVFLMVAHGLSCAALFLLANAVRARAGTYRLDELGGLAKQAPVLAALFVAATMASIGLPGFGNFWGEMGVFLALRDQSLWLQAAVASTVVISAVYALRAVAATFYGEPSAALARRLAVAPVADLGATERFAAGLLLAASLLIGFRPGLVTNLTQDYCQDIAKNSALPATPAKPAAPTAPAPSAR